MSARIDLSSLPDDLPCSLTLGSGELTVGDLRRAFGASDADLLEMDPEDMTEEQVRRATREMWARRATENL